MDTPASELKKEFCFDDHFYGSVTVGERGQIVIPAEARKRYHIETGDKLLILGTPTEKGLTLCKIGALREFMNTFLEALQRAEEIEDMNTKHDEGAS